MRFSKSEAAVALLVGGGVLVFVLSSTKNRSSMNADLGAVAPDRSGDSVAQWSTVNQINACLLAFSASTEPLSNTESEARRDSMGVCLQSGEGQSPAASKPMPSASQYSDEQRRAASSVMANVRAIATTEEEDGGRHLILRFSATPSPTDPEQRLRFVKAVADADAVLRGTSRMIFFYRPDGSQFAQADPLRGSHLKGD